MLFPGYSPTYYVVRIAPKAEEEPGDEANNQYNLADSVYIVESECLVADGTIATYNTRVWSYY